MTEDIEKMDFERLVSNQLSPGEMLKQAREAKNLSHIDVAKQLKLRVQWIVDIENDHYKDAAALIYVRGYLSSYARLVHLPPEEVLNAFNAMNFDEPFKVQKQPNLSEEQFVSQRQVLPYSKPKKNVGKRVAKVVSVIIVLALIALVVLWWRGQKVQSPNVKGEPDVTLPVETESKNESLPIVNPKQVSSSSPIRVKHSHHVGWKKVS